MTRIEYTINMLKEIEDSHRLLTSSVRDVDLIVMHITHEGFKCITRSRKCLEAWGKLRKDLESNPEPYINKQMVLDMMDEYIEEGTIEDV